MTYRSLLYLGLIFGTLQTLGTLAGSWLVARGHFGLFGEERSRRSLIYSTWISVAMWAAVLAGVVAVITGHANDPLLPSPM